MSRQPVDQVLPLTPVVFHILLALSREARHGYAVAQEVEEMTDGRVRMGPGTLYGSLQRMRDDGLIEEVEAPRGQDRAHAGRPRRYYALTELGRQALVEDSARLARALRALPSGFSGS